MKEQRFEKVVSYTVESSKDKMMVWIVIFLAAGFTLSCSPESRSVQNDWILFIIWIIFGVSYHILLHFVGRGRKVYWRQIK
jgi:hypothetical protein